MATLENTMRSALADAFDARVNTGSGTAVIKFETSGDTAVATVSLQNPAFGDATNGVITLAGTPLQDTNAAGGTMAQASIYDRNAAKVAEFTVGTSGNEINFAGGVVVTAGDTVELTSFTVTVPA